MDRYVFKASSNMLFISLMLIISMAVNFKELYTSKNIIDVTQKAFKTYEVRGLVIVEIMKAHPIKQLIR